MLFQNFKMKHLIFDAGPLINFSMNNLLHILEKLKKEFKGDFLITKEVKQEIIDTPITIQKYELSGIRLKEVFDRKIIKHADLSKKQVDELRERRERIMQIANNLFRTNQGPIHLIDKGESAALALSQMTNYSPLVIDERTTRMLCENPENLRKLMEKKLHTSIKSDKSDYDFFKNFKVIRSTELIYIAHKKGIIELKDPRAYEAMLYGLKFKGCSISEAEVEEMKKL